jgi:hypothetical protein
MELEEMRNIWHRHLDRPSSAGEIRLIAGLVEKSAHNLERTIHWRDIRETVVAVAAMLFFGWFATWKSSSVGRLGCVVGVAWALTVIWKLRNARLAGKPPAEPLPVAGYLTHERQRLCVQIDLLKSIAWWYIAPLVVSINLVMWAWAPSNVFFVSYLVGSLLFAILIWWINQYVVQHTLKPLVDDIDSVARQMTAEPE